MFRCACPYCRAIQEVSKLIVGDTVICSRCGAKLRVKGSRKTKPTRAIPVEGLLAEESVQPLKLRCRSELSQPSVMAEETAPRPPVPPSRMRIGGCAIGFRVLSLLLAVVGVTCLVVAFNTRSANQPLGTNDIPTQIHFHAEVELPSDPESKQSRPRQWTAEDYQKLQDQLRHEGLLPEQQRGGWRQSPARCSYCNGSGETDQPCGRCRGSGFTRTIPLNGLGRDRRFVAIAVVAVDFRNADIVRMECRII